MKYKNNKFENKPKINLQRAKGRGGRGEGRKRKPEHASTYDPKLKYANSSCSLVKLIKTSNKPACRSTD